MLNRLLLGVVLVGLLPLGARFWWVFELATHFRLQYLALAAVALVAAIGARRRRLALLVTATAALNVWPVLPWLPSQRWLPTGSPAAEQQTGDSLVVLTFNVHGSNADNDRVIETIRAADADLVTLIELRGPLDAALERLAATHPYSATFPTTDNFGLGILSKHPLAQSIPFELGPTVALESRVAIGERELTLIAVHPFAPTSSERAAMRTTQLAELAARVRAIDGPLLVCGDFNVTPYSPYFRDFESASATLDLRRGMGPGFTWPSTMPLLGIPIDHCLARGPFEALRFERMDSAGSDHYPTRITLRWQGDP